MFPRNGPQTSRPRALLGRGNEQHVDESLLVALKKSATTAPMRPTFRPTADSRKFVDAVAIMMISVKITVEICRPETIDVDAQCVQTNILKDIRR